MYIDTEAANKGSKVRIKTTSPSASNVSQENTPLLDAFVGQAPPSYLEATTPNLWNARPSGDEERRLLSFDTRGDDAPPLADPLDGMYKGPNYSRRRSFREHCTKRRMLKWIAAILAIVILAAILAAVTHKDKKTAVSPIPVPVEPAQSSVPPGGLFEPPKEYPIRWPSRCGKDYNIKTETFDFGSPSDLQIQERTQSLDVGFKRVSGWIHVTQAPEDQPAGTIRAKFSYAVSSAVDVDSIKYESSANGLFIGEPWTKGVLDGLQRGPNCLGMSVVVFVGKGAKLENFNVESQHLGMQVYEGVDISVSNTTSISLTSGTLDMNALNSRYTHLESVSGSISGKYALIDLLYVNTISGSVNINVEPKESGEDGSGVAIFNAKSLSGSIRADYERKSIPERDFQVFIDTNVGSIDGTFIHGSKTSLKSVAGGITVDLLPLESGDHASLLDTSTDSGQIAIEMRPPYKAKGKVLNKLTSTHRTVSGAIHLTYPQEWEGHLTGESLSGALHMQGRDLELIDEVAGPGKNRVEAKKGKGTSELVFGTVSGGCEIKVGNQ